MAEMADTIHGPPYVISNCHDVPLKLS